MNESLRLGTIRGIAVGVNWSLLLIAGLLCWVLAAVTLPDAAPHYGWAAYTITSALMVLLFFAALLAHELAHSVVARRAGVEVERITLWLFGGVSQLRGEAHTPASEFQIAIVGPLTSLVLALAFLGLAGLVAVVNGPTLAVVAAAWLGGISLLLALFNLLPGAPLDGGRVVHALVWRRTGSHERATEVACRSGQWVGYGLVAVGVLALLGGDILAFWFVLIGWFLIVAARAEATHELLSDALAPLRVRDVMTADPIVAPADLPIDDLLEGWFIRRGHSAFPLRSADGRIEGLVTLSGLRRARDRGGRVARDVADGIDRVATGAPDDPVPTLLRSMGTAPGGDGRALIFDADQLVGIVSPSDLQRALDVVALRRAHPRAAARSAPGPESLRSVPPASTDAAGPTGRTAA